MPVLSKILCSALGSPGPAIISSTSSAVCPTLTISGASNVTLTYLEIRDGHTPTDGGGIAYVGTGTLTLNDVLVDSNFGGNGGGIGMTAQGGTVALEPELQLARDQQYRAGIRRRHFHERIELTPSGRF